MAGTRDAKSAIEAASHAQEPEANQESEGGPRAGGSAAVMAAMCACASGVAAWTAGATDGSDTPGVAGGAPPSTHSGQSR